MANDSCSRHELALAVAPCCSVMSASDAVGSAGTYLEYTTQTCPGHLKDQTPWALHSQCGAGLVVKTMKYSLEQVNGIFQMYWQVCNIQHGLFRHTLIYFRSYS